MVTQTSQVQGQCDVRLHVAAGSDHDDSHAEASPHRNPGPVLYTRIHADMFLA